MNGSSQQFKQGRQGELPIRNYFSACLRRISQNRYLNVLAGLVLIVVSVDEVWESLSDGFQFADLNSSLGVVIVGLSHTLKSLPDLLEGLEHLEKNALEK